MVVGFFSDDDSACYAASLVSCGLACADRRMPVIEGQDVGRPSPGPAVADAAPSRTNLVTALAAAIASGERDVAFVAPLDLLHEEGVEPLLDVAVVSGGNPLQTRRAKRSANYVTRGASIRGPATPGAVRHAAGGPWLLPFGARRLRGASMAQGPRPHGQAVEPALRTLPVWVPVPGGSLKAAMERGLPTLEALRVGILLAATLEVAVADPDVASLGPETMAELMSPTSQPADSALAGRLSALADRLDDIERALGGADASCPSTRQARSPRRLGGRPGRLGFPEQVRASWPRGGTAVGQGR